MTHDLERLRRYPDDPDAQEAIDRALSRQTSRDPAHVIVNVYMNPASGEEIVRAMNRAARERSR